MLPPHSMISSIIPPTRWYSLKPAGQILMKAWQIPGECQMVWDGDRNQNPVVKQLCMGFTVRYKLLMKTGGSSKLRPYYVPGFGKNIGTSAFGFNYYISYRLPFRKKTVFLDENEKVIKKSSSNNGVTWVRQCRNRHAGKVRLIFNKRQILSGIWFWDYGYCYPLRRIRIKNTAMAHLRCWYLICYIPSPA